MQATAHATGCDDVSTDTDPTMYAKLSILTDKDDNADAHAALLSEVYPIIERVKRRNESRIAQCGLKAVIGEITRELDTLYSVKVAGVPTVYNALRSECKRRIASLTEKTHLDEMTGLARKMFWRKPNSNLTSWGSLMASLLGEFAPRPDAAPQRKLWLLLFLRSHKCVANHVGSSAYIICCGRPRQANRRRARTGSQMALALQRMNDGESAKAHTALDLDADMQVMFQDELQEHVSGDNVGDNAKQTLISNGVLKTKRLVKNDEGNFVLQETVCANRAMRVTCTNNINDVKDDPEQGDHCGVPRCKSKRAG